MAENEIKVRLQSAYKTESEWTASNPILKEGEVGYVADSNVPNYGRYKIGDGTTTWKNLPWGDQNIQEKFDDLEIGGRNLLVGTNQGKYKWSNDHNGGTYGIEYVEWYGVNAVKMTCTTATTSWRMFTFNGLLDNFEKLEPGGTYTLSYDIVGNIGVPLSDLWAPNASNSITSRIIKIKQDATEYGYHYEYRIVLKNPLVKADQVVYLDNNLTDNTEVIIANLKLEKGNKATDWTPAPEDKADVSHTHPASDITSGTLSSDRLPTVPVSKGGTGLTSLTSGQALIGNGTGTITTRVIDTTSGGTSGSTSLITSGAVYAGLSGKANSSHSHSYLPLSGGTVTGATQFNNYLKLNAWSGYGTGTANFWYDANNKFVEIENATNLKLSGTKVSKEGHTHNYAGSDSSGGSATSAVKLDSSAGTATQPIYFSGGKPVLCTYGLNATVPSGAVFTDTKVTQTAINASDYTNWRPLVIGNSNSSTEGFTPSSVTDGVITAATITCQPSSGTIRATTFKGALSGNAATATKASQDASGNTITSSYAASLSASGRTLTLKSKSGTTLSTVTTQDTTYSAGGGISLSGNTFSNSGVRSIATGDTIGGLLVNTNGTITNVGINGIGSTDISTIGDGTITGAISELNNNLLYGTIKAEHVASFWGNPAMKCSTSSGTYWTLSAFTSVSWGYLDWLVEKNSNDVITIKRTGVYVFSVRFGINSIAGGKRVEIVPFINGKRLAAKATSHNTTGDYTIVKLIEYTLRLSIGDTVCFKIAPIDSYAVMVQIADCLIECIDYQN